MACKVKQDTATSLLTHMLCNMNDDKQTTLQHSRCSQCKKYLYSAMWVNPSLETTRDLAALRLPASFVQRAPTFSGPNMVIQSLMIPVMHSNPISIVQCMA